jgi:hypothetical protein
MFFFQILQYCWVVNMLHDHILEMRSLLLSPKAASLRDHLLSAHPVHFVPEPEYVLVLALRLIFGRDGEPIVVVLFI